MAGNIYKSSFVGITISICGNICISLALNLQKLAHKKLQDDCEPSRKFFRTRNFRKKFTNQLSAEGISSREEGEHQGDEEDDEDEVVSVETTEDFNERSNLIRGSLKRNRNKTTNKFFGRGISSDDSNNGFIDEFGENNHQNSRSFRKTDLNYLYSPTWWAGLVLMSLGEFGNFLSYGFAPASLVAPLGTVALISNGIFANLLLGEKFKRWDIFGIILAVLGTFTIVLSSPRSTQAFTPEKLLEAISQIPFLIFTLTCLITVVFLGFLSHSSLGDRYIFIDVGICAILGGFTVLSTKAFSSLLNTLFLECFSYSITWAMCIVMIVTAVTQVIFLNRALQKFDSKYVVPIQFVLFTIMAILGSTILYRDFTQVGTLEVFDFVFGCGLIFIGVYILTTSKTEEDDLSDDDEEEEEEGVNQRQEEERRELLGVREEEEEGSRRNFKDQEIQPRRTRFKNSSLIEDGSGSDLDFYHGRFVASDKINIDQNGNDDVEVLVNDTSSSSNPIVSSIATTTTMNTMIRREMNLDNSTAINNSVNVKSISVKRKRSNQILFPGRGLSSPGYYLIANTTNDSSSSAS